MPEMIPRRVSWSKNATFKRSDYKYLFGKVKLFIKFVVLMLAVIVNFMFLLAVK